MKILLKHIICLLFFFCIDSSVFAQFNTLRYEKVTPNIKETIHKIDSVSRDKKVTRKKKSSWFKRLFKRKKKRNFEYQIDSLKNLILKQNKEQKQNINQIESSLGNIIKKEVAKASSKKAIATKKELPKIHTPLKLMFITSSFGVRKHPIDSVFKMHNGIDLKANYDRVYAIMNGEVKETGFDKERGKYMKVSHSDRIETIYLHLSEIYYKKGEKVNAGFIIAKSGNTGKSTSPHLHFAIKENGKYINPMSFLNQLIEINNILNINKNGK